MPIFNRFVDSLLFKGGILATGIICLYLSKNDFLPRYMNPVSYGLASLGALGVLIGLTAEEERNVNEDENYDPTYEERMREFQRLKPELQRKINEQTRMMMEYEISRRRGHEMDRLEKDSLRFEEVLRSYERRQKKPQMEGTSAESENRGRCSESPVKASRRHGKSGSLSEQDLPSWFTSYWRKRHLTKWLVLFIGTAMAISGYYISSSLIILDVRQELWVVCSLFWGTAGVFLIVWSLVSYILSDRRQFPDVEIENSDELMSADHIPIETVML